MSEIAAYIAGGKALVTGAGGSIGSELCLEVAGYNPAYLSPSGTVRTVFTTSCWSCVRPSPHWM